MSRKHIKFIAAKQGSDEWLALRQQGVGGSEIGGVLGIADYIAPINVYLNKIGEPAPTFEGNRFSRFGKLLEDMIADLYQYWSADGDCNTMLINKEEGRKLRKVARVNGYIVNEKWPWLYASLDMKVIGDPRGRLILETKNTTTMEKDRYTHGFNPSFYAQLQQYIMIDEADGGDVGIYYDGNNFDVKPVYPDPDVHKLIVDESKAFWLRVLKAREIKNTYGIVSYYGQHMDFIPEEQREGVAMLQSLEPDLTGTEKEYDFIKTLIKPTKEFTEMPGTDAQMALIQKYIQAGVNKKIAVADQTRVKEELVLSLGGYHQASWGKGLDFSYKPDKNGKCRFYISKGLVPDED